MHARKLSLIVHVETAVQSRSPIHTPGACNACVSGVIRHELAHPSRQVEPNTPSPQVSPKNRSIASHHRFSKNFANSIEKYSRAVC